MRFRPDVGQPALTTAFFAIRVRRRVKDGRATGNVIAVDFVARRVLPPDDAADGTAVTGGRHLRVVRVPGERR